MFRGQGCGVCIFGLLVRERDRLFRSSDRQTDIRIATLFSAVGLGARIDRHDSGRQFNPIFFMCRSVPPPSYSLLARLDTLADHERCYKQKHDREKSQGNRIHFLATQALKAAWINTNICRMYFPMVLGMVTVAGR